MTAVKAVGLMAVVLRKKEEGRRKKKEERSRGVVDKKMSRSSLIQTREIYAHYHKDE